MVATFRQPFDLLAKIAVSASRTAAGETAKTAKTEIWLGDLDSNQDCSVQSRELRDENDAISVAAPALAGAKPVTVASARTGPDGRFSVRVRAAGPSRTLCLAYRGVSGIGPPVATRKLMLRVRAGVVLHVTPRVASVGRSIRFSGRLRAGPVPPGGKQLVLEARAPGGTWLEFRVVRTNARGRFHAGYRFRFPGPARYQFRALSEPESDYPFAAGTSNVVGVFER